MAAAAPLREQNSRCGGHNVLTRVTEASSGDDVLSLARAVRYDAVLLDINMPGRNGTDICRELRGLFPRLACWK